MIFLHFFVLDLRTGTHRRTDGRTDRQTGATLNAHLLMQLRRKKNVEDAYVECLLLQVVFRKIADVLREKELAERDIYDPPAELSTDHPVRRLISRFRKLSCSRLPVGPAGMPLSDFNAGDTLAVETLSARKTHSVDATNCSTADVHRRPSTSESATNKCTVSNGGTAVSSGCAAWRRLLSRASSVDVTAATTTAAVIALPSNSDNSRCVKTGNSEERALLSDNALPRTPRTKWSSLLSRVNVPDNTTASADDAAVATADNEVFDDEEVDEESSPVKDVVVNRSAVTADATVKLRASVGESVSSSCADEVPELETAVTSRRQQRVLRSLDDDESVGDMTNLRSELNRQLGAVHERIDDVSQRLDVVLRLLADSRPQAAQLTLQPVISAKR